jgi:uncharacterized protein (TIGR02466 family)
MSNDNENKRIESLFAVPLFIKDFKFQEKNRFIENARQYPAKEISNAGGFQSDFLNPSDEVVADFMNQAMEDVTAAVGFLGVESSTSFAVDGIWMNINDTDHWNHIHNHPGADFAVVIYLKVPEDSGDIVFYSNDPIKQYMSFYSTPLLKDTPFSRLQYAHTPTEDSMVIFPGHVFHNVQVNESDKERVSVAFNLKVNRNNRQLASNSW